MAGPTTVEEYLRQIPNPAPCPHSASTTDPPCHDCIERRITTATALRAGQDPSVALGLTPAPPVANGAVVAPPPPAAAPDATEQILTTAITPSDQVAMEQQLAMGVDEPVDPDDFDDEGFPLPEHLRGPKNAQHVTLHSHENAHDTIDEAVAQLKTNEPPVPEGAFMPGMQALLDQQVDPLTPGMTRTDIQPTQAMDAPKTAQAPDPAALLAQMTGGAVAGPSIETTPPQMVQEGTTTRPLAPLELSPEQVQRRNEIERGTHPSVAPVNAPPRSELLGYAQKGYEVGEHIVWPIPDHPQGLGITLPVGEPLTTGDALMVHPATGLVVRFVPTPEQTAAAHEEATPDFAAAVADLHGAAEAEARVEHPAPPVPDRYVKTERNSSGQLYGWTGTDWEGPLDEPQGLNGHEGGEIDDQGSSARQAEVDVQAAMAALTPEAERKPLHPAGHRDALIKYVKAHWPAVTVDKDNVSYVVIDLLASLVVLQALGHEAVHAVLGAEAPLDYVPSPEAVAAADAALQTVTAPPTQPATGPVAEGAPVDAITAAAAVAAPVQVEPGELTQHCVHGMPGTDFTTNPPRSASCVDCMNDGGPPPSISKLRATRFQQAHLETTCARAMCNRTIYPGQIIGLVENVGWCCSVCTKPERARTTTA